MRDLAIYIVIFLSAGLFVACATPRTGGGEANLSYLRGQCITFTGSLESSCSVQTQLCEDALNNIERFETRGECLAHCEAVYVQNRKRFPQPFPCNTFVRKANSSCVSYCESLGN